MFAMLPSLFKLNKHWIGCCIVLLAGGWWGAAYAGVVIYGTRVIYSEGMREQQVRLMNDGGSPLLVQAWLDRGEGTVVEEEMVPFVMTPPVFRMGPGRGQTLRILHTGELMPQDKESVFWLNVLEIPPKAQPEAGEGVLQLAIRTRIKLFFRPATLAEGPKEPEKQLRWSVLDKRENGAVAVRVENPTPYFVSFMDAQLRAGEQVFPLRTTMVAPGGSEIFELASPSGSVPVPEKVEFNLIDDIGGVRYAEQRLQ